MSENKDYADVVAEETVTEEAAAETEDTGAKGKRKASKKKPGPAEGARKALIYLGPNVPGGILHSGAVFKDGIPEYMNSLLIEMPEIEKMFVDVKEAGKTRMELSRQGTEAYRLYQQAGMKLRGKVKGGAR